MGVFMSQQFPPPGQQPPPGYGYPPQAPKKSSAGKIVGFGCLGIVGLVVVIGIAGAALSGGEDDGKTATPPAASSAASGQPEAPASAAPEKKAAVEVTAKKTPFKASVLAQGDDYTSVSVTVTNNSSKSIDVNPLYFTITDTGGGKHTSELGVDEGQIGTVELAPGENVTGTVTSKGKFTPKSVAYTDGLIGKAIRADVS
ncbi:DUF4352 domain-containing protein [Streptomyces sp. NPDC057939]|uniref:DUF4352 domain-containing protein n=1 Tax=Streptomyces sp. NPDC057939 TaxID=3346284 RepID=UPI0036F065AB